MPPKGGGAQEQEGVGKGTGRLNSVCFLWGPQEQ